MTQPAEQPASVPRRRLELLHTLGFLAHPGNASVLAGRAARRALGREAVIHKPGSTIDAAWLARLLGDAAAVPAQTFAFIDAHRRWVAQAHGQQTLHATDRRQAATQTIAQRCVAVSLPKEDGRVLYQLTRQIGARRVIEMGTAFGVGTRYLAAGVRDGGHAAEGRLWTIEADAPRQQIACQQIDDLQALVVPMPGTVEDQMPQIGPEAAATDLVFIDALHTFDATWGYFELIRRWCGGRTLCVFHDVNSSWEMARVWKRIVAHDATTQAASWRRLGLCIVRGDEGGGA